MSAHVEMTQLVKIEILGEWRHRRSGDPTKVVTADFLSFLLEEGIFPAHKTESYVGATTYRGFFWAHDVPKIQAWLKARGLDVTERGPEDGQDPEEE